MKTQFRLPVLFLIGAASLAFTVPKPKKPIVSKATGWISIFDGKTLKGWHVVTDKKFTDFELKWDWKIEKGCNSGVMYHVVEGPKWHAPYETGPEYQIIDDIGFPQKLENWQKAGADYAMHTANDQKVLKPVGEWNSSRIVFRKGHVEHWLNGKKIVEFEAWSDDWNKKRTEGKWKDYPDYGKAKTGEIALQDHGDKAYYKNIFIREL
jgi:hypothetical protein